MKKGKKEYLYEMRTRNGRFLGIRKIAMTEAEADKWMADLKKWVGMKDDNPKQ